MMPDGVDAAKVIDHAYRRYELSLGAGLGELGGKAFRIGHLGDLNQLMLAGALSGVELALNDAGVNVELGSGVSAALRYWRANSLANAVANATANTTANTTANGTANAATTQAR